MLFSFVRVTVREISGLGLFAFQGTFSSQVPLYFAVLYALRTIGENIVHTMTDWKIGLFYDVEWYNQN